MLVNPLGNEVRANLKQSVNALEPMLVNPLGNEVRAKFLQPENA